jgi:hypothetical protein
MKLNIVHNYVVRSHIMQGYEINILFIICLEIKMTFRVRGNCKMII